MYRAFIKKGVKSEQQNDIDLEACKEKDSTVDESVSNEVKRLWELTESQCIKRTCQGEKCPQFDLLTDLGWDVVRVFVSSTFNDFFNEREVLVKKVFPELREWCHERGLKFVECDLRWGIPKDTPTGDTILVCLDEIQCCRDKNRGMPFFIGLIGERLCGAFLNFLYSCFFLKREQNTNAAFFLRDESIAKSVPETFKQRFMESEQLPKHHLQVMKQKLKERFLDQVYPYTCKVDGISTETGREQVKITELDDFAEKVLKFLKNAIERTYPDTNRNPDLVQSSSDFDKRMQRLFVMDNAQRLIGRRSELDVLRDFVDSGYSNDLEMTGKAEDWDLQEDDSKVCVVEGQSGQGKSALLSYFVENCLKENRNIFYHMVGSTPSSISVEVLLQSLLKALVPTTGDEESEANESNKESHNVAHFQKLLCKALSSFRKMQDKTLVICIDALDQLEGNSALDHLSWLPPTFPHNVRCIVSTSLHRPTASRLFEYPVLKLDLDPLPEQHLQQIMTTYLGNFCKKLEPGQVEKIIKDTTADSPLWVMLMAEELRVFGDFRLMADRIESFPHSLDEFLVQVLGRLIQEDNEQGLIKKVLCLVACSRSGGLPSQSLLRLCGDLQTEEELPLMYWAQARRTLKPYLRVSMVVDDTVTFAHQAVFKAVNSLLLSTEALRKDWYIQLADYYQQCCSEPRVKVYNLPYYLQRTNLKKRLVDFVTKDKDAYKLIPPWHRSHLLEAARCHGLADAVMPNTAPVLMCHSCATFSHFHPSCTWPTRDCCMLCSNYCGGGLKGVPARACARHAGARGPQKYKCLKCNAVVQEKPIGLSGPVVPTFAKLCSHCGFGNNGKRCAHLTCY
ncbi:telomerase protein component 1-like [Elysia marginata]|uniref:Telomerase protein component 1-like n=1 Tax=Elysia marginata TaxID=1093978 RepID=A0AAV4I5S4_9GAST|nr:telomerase protein component 1-like [Elysia marginata]